MTDWPLVRRIVATLPQAVERRQSGGVAQWCVRRRRFAWQHRLGPADRAGWGNPAAVPGPLLAAVVTDVAAKERLIAGDPRVFVTTTGYDGQPVVLLRLERAAPAAVAEVLVGAWLVRAPRRVTAQFRRGSW